MDETPPEEAIRVGSPFAMDSEPAAISLSDAKVMPDAALQGNAGSQVGQPHVSADPSPETFYDVGPLRYTALGSVSAAAMVLVFAFAALWWFPAGGTLIAGLGCVLSIFGLYSPIPKRSAACLVLHMVVFVVCYTRAITG